ncbi:MAG: biotin/lipoyl-binding protein, partial [Rubrivivax sp.]|nr:biotin/lipoyl-binding protein [Rubrivivax sp.]
MKKKWLLSGLALVVVAGAGIAVVSGALKLPGGQAMAKTDADAGKPKAGKDGKKPDVPLEFVPQEVVQPALARLSGSVEFSGPLVAPQTALVRAKASGTLLALSVAEGSRVRAGQVLGRIELAELNTRVAERSAHVESMRASLVQAERTHASNERLAAQQFISSNALESSRSGLDTARANLNAAQASLETTRVGLREASLQAPISGIV